MVYRWIEKRGKVLVEDRWSELTTLGVYGGARLEGYRGSRFNNRPSIFRSRIK
jgi:hypothetical protein